MGRKRLTQVFPFLLPLRRWQRKKQFYFLMKIDGNDYAKSISEEVLPHKVFETSSLMVNKSSGYDIKYQINKIDNLKVAAKTIDKIVIKPNETFSFWQLVKGANKDEYKEGLDLVDGKIISSYGGGLCQLSNMLYWLFLHTPLTVVERHGHGTSSFRTSSDALKGIDATISQGWLDLKVKNETTNTFQIKIFFDNDYMYGQVLAKDILNKKYQVFNSNVTYRKEKDDIYEIATVSRYEIDTNTGSQEEVELYINRSIIGYLLPDDVIVEGE